MHLKCVCLCVYVTALREIRILFHLSPCVFYHPPEAFRNPQQWFPVFLHRLQSVKLLHWRQKTLSLETWFFSFILPSFILCKITKKIASIILSILDTDLFRLSAAYHFFKARKERPQDRLTFGDQLSGCTKRQKQIRAMFPLQETAEAKSCRFMSTDWRENWHFCAKNNKLNKPLSPGNYMCVLPNCAATYAFKKIYRNCNLDWQQFFVEREVLRVNKKRFRWGVDVDTLTCVELK